MTERCPAVAELGRLAELAPGDPGRAHIDGCARCRSLLAAYGDFVAGSPDHADSGRENEVSAFLEREIIGPGESEVGSAGAAGDGPFSWLRSRFVVPALATAAVILMAVAWQPWELVGPRGPSRVTRGATPPAGVAALDPQATITKNGAARLTWNRLPEADRYEVVFYSAALLELATADAGGAIEWTVSAAQWAGWRSESGPLIWRVRAFRRGDLLAVSPPATLVGPDPE